MKITEEKKGKCKECDSHDVPFFKISLKNRTTTEYVFRLCKKCFTELKDKINEITNKTV